MFALAASVALASHTIFALFVAFNGTPNVAGSCSDSLCRMPKNKMSTAGVQLHSRLLSACYIAELDAAACVLALAHETPEHRALLTSPSRFRADAITLQPTETSRDARLWAERRYAWVSIWSEADGVYKVNQTLLAFALVLSSLWGWRSQR